MPNKPTSQHMAASVVTSLAWSLDVSARRRGRCGQTEVKNELCSRSRGKEAVTQPVSTAELHLMSSSGCHTFHAWNVLPTPRIENIETEHNSASGACLRLFWLFYSLQLMCVFCLYCVWYWQIAQPGVRLQKKLRKAPLLLNVIWWGKRKKQQLLFHSKRKKNERVRGLRCSTELESK